ncbi:hypothetical protein UFOVP669_15 [uncultured Caudovirales phage]|uniref:Uncharacterized protein n=1 Tax=uncultured Caudovirales phage TaxID=2100421 RepID=A0A6J5SHH4_9CAUD|nr:hypothetical protein UFOVP400_6 [uncultured Caudovirales phage]CAB4155559.1 hypothetical protein UFOVP669_15 [uncultured Caudovirales phage]CAB4213584.1 hypothetical protein UFOVP1449_56 [uncultured Caudovirales phage]
MTISTTISRAEYAGNGVTTIFAFPYPFFADADLTVLLLRSTGVVDTLVLNTDYAVSGENTPSSGQVTLTVAPASGESLFILRQLDLTQETDYISGDPFPAESHERALDRLTLISQQLQEQIDRSLTLNETTTGVSAQLPAPEPNALIGWNTAADALQNYSGQSGAPVSAAMAPVVAAATLALARGEMGAQVAGSYAASGAVGSSGITMSTARLLGRTTASTGAVEEISVGAGLSLVGGSLSAAILRGYIDGLTMSTAGASTTMTIAAGQATDSTNAALITLAASINKTTGAWAVGSGSGGIDTGTIANSTWYYFYLIRRPDTGVVDVVFSLNSTSPALPANYTQFRYIGAGLTNGSAQWTQFTQTGDEFMWSTPVLDFSGAGSATAALLTCSLPRGRKMKGFFSVVMTQSVGSDGAIYLSDPANADLVPSRTVAPLSTKFSATGSAADATGANAQCWTNTSAQIRHREANTNTCYIATLGWQDLRGRSV